MKLTQQQLQELKEIEKNIFLEFISVCEALNLKYYIIGGTLLGAVRHSGFIPWDDDIDVGMLREDYEIFLEKGQELLPEGYFIQSNRTDAEYSNCFAKIRNSNTTYLETIVNNRNINHGVFIDIFPLDFYPDDRKLRKHFAFRKKILDVRINSVYNLKNKSQKQKLIEMLAKTIYPSFRTACKKRDKLLKSFRNGTLLANHGGAWGHKEIIPSEWYGDGTMLKFDGIDVRVPIKYDRWLTQVYGDYMQLPPEEKRHPHHYIDVIDLKQSYTKYTGKANQK